LQNYYDTEFRFRFNILGTLYIIYVFETFLSGWLPEMTTLAESFGGDDDATAIIIPAKGSPLTVTYQQLNNEIGNFQRKLANLGIRPGDAVSIALQNSYEFIVSFIAATWQRGIAAPLNSAYKQEEFEFYIDDLSSALALVPYGSFEKNGPAVRAARKYKAAIAECYWNGKEVVLDVKETGKLASMHNQPMEKPRPDDTALVLHTSGTTGRPKAVGTFTICYNCDCTDNYL
jgi:oxalate---CoA ligase